MTWAIKRRNGGIDGNDALMDDVSLWEPTDDYGNGPWIEIVPAKRVKELEDKLNEACDYIPQWFIDKYDLRPQAGVSQLAEERDLKS